MVLALAMETDCKVWQNDIPTAFLHPPVGQTIAMEMAPGRKDTDRGGVPNVGTPHNDVCGMSQAPANRHAIADEFVKPL